MISGTGSAGMETVLANFVEPNQKLAVFTAGYFSERLVEMGRRHGANVVCSSKSWGDTFTEAEAAAFIDREKPHAVAFVHAETSTGARQDLAAITAPRPRRQSHHHSGLRDLTRSHADQHRCLRRRCSV